ncbi:MAG: hypothetical protein AAFW87_08640 [Pseudomonadota bacterium]
MSDRKKSVLGVVAPAVRPTALAALIVAVVLAIPAFVVLTVLDALV